MKSLLAAVGCILVCGCNTLTHFNSTFDVAFSKEPRTANAPIYRPPAAGLARATLHVDGKRGNPKVLFFLALSGGGSRAAHFSGLTMLRLQTVFKDVDLLREVDVISSVSGGSLPAAYYAISRDEDPGFGGALRESVTEILALQARPEARRLWRDKEVRDLMTRDYLIRSTLNWFWPSNIVAYWLTSYDRSDIMAKTLEDNLYDTPRVGTALTFADLNPERPFLILNATSATEQAKANEFSFGSVFTFTQDDFVERLNSDIRAFPLARAVQASAAFPAVYANVTLRDFRPYEDGPSDDTACDKGYADRKDDQCDPRYLHVFDGGNSDNLGLRSVKRALLEMENKGELQAYDKVIVLLVDAFTKPKGARRTDFDPRSFFGRLIDPNVLDAVDSLLQANRANLVGEFRDGMLGWTRECGMASVRHFPASLCDRLQENRETDVLDLRDRLIFYHFSFESAPEPLKRKLDVIPTSFSIEDEDTDAIDKTVRTVLHEHNPCLQALRSIVLDPKMGIRGPREACNNAVLRVRVARPDVPEQAPPDSDRATK